MMTVENRVITLETSQVGPLSVIFIRTYIARVHDIDADTHSHAVSFFSPNAALRSGADGESCMSDERLSACVGLKGRPQLRLWTACLRLSELSAARSFKGETKEAV